jgi:hypothetical protein
MRLSIAALTVLMLSSTSALADDWTVVRVRGGVFALDNGQWVQLLRNSVVSDDRIIRSAPDGRATFVRGAETIEVGSGTTIQIDDTKSGFTTVYEHAGTVGVDAEARNVQHFAVQTPFVAAVVKGTAFVVETNAAASVVAVSRGTVAVHDEHFGTDVAVAAGSAVNSGNAPVTEASLMPIPAALPDPPAPAARQPPVPAIAESAGRNDVPASRGDGPVLSCVRHGKCDGAHGNYGRPGGCHVLGQDKGG